MNKQNQTIYILINDENLNLIMGNNQECLEFDSIADVEKALKC